jgi:hypothetical protein
MATPASMAAANLFMIILPAPRAARQNWPEGRHTEALFFRASKKYWSNGEALSTSILMESDGLCEFFRDPQ